MTDKEITRMVMLKYPLTEKEKEGCRNEISRMKHIREYYKNRLVERFSQKECDTTKEI